MVEYIKTFVKWVLKASSNRRGDTQDKEVLLVISPHFGAKELVKLLNYLLPTDFEPSHQSEFARIRGNVEWLADGNEKGPGKYTSVLTPLLTVLDHYRGPGSGGSTREFSFVSDVGLKAIIERDYAELVIRIYPTGAWKSCVIVAGSILEALLMDRLAKAAWHGTAMASGRVPRSRNGAVIPMDDWTLNALIDVALDIRSLPADPANTIHQVLRDYRNFVHPKKEIRAAHSCGEAEAMLSVGALNSVCNYLDRNP